MCSAIHELATLQLYSQYAPAILRYLTLLTGSREEAEDLVQETFLKVLGHGGPSPSVDSVEAWLYTIARNAAYDGFRRHRRRPAIAQGFVHLDRLPIPDTTAHVGERDEVQAALRHLPEAYRAPLLLHAVAGYTLEELAATLGIKLGTVKSRLHRARARFRAAYTNI